MGLDQWVGIVDYIMGLRDEAYDGADVNSLILKFDGLR